MKKKIVSILAGMTLLGSMLVGCSANKEVTNTVSTEGTAVAHLMQRQRRY